MPNYLLQTREHVLRRTAYAARVTLTCAPLPPRRSCWHAAAPHIPPWHRLCLLPARCTPPAARHARSALPPLKRAVATRSETRRNGNGDALHTAACHHTAACRAFAAGMLRRAPRRTAPARCCCRAPSRCCRAAPCWLWHLFALAHTCSPACISTCLLCWRTRCAGAYFLARCTAHWRFAFSSARATPLPYRAALRAVRAHAHRRALSPPATALGNISPFAARAAAARAIPRRAALLLPFCSAPRCALLPARRAYAPRRCARCARTPRV